MTYRGNLARLIEVLIQKGDFEKAEEIADLAMAKMPVDLFGFYTLLEPYIGAYYELKAIEKARKLYSEVSGKYQENLTYYSTLSEYNQSQYIQNIYNDIERYRGLVDVTAIYETETFTKAEMEKFNSYLRLFTGELEGDDKQADQIEDEIEDTL